MKRIQPYYEFELGIHLGLAVRRHREWRNLNQAALARKANISQSAISQVENASDLNIKTLSKISQALDLKLSDLIHLAEQMGESQEVKTSVEAFLTHVDLSPRR